MDDVKSIPTGWHIEDTSPSGINRLLPDECRPISLPYTRTFTQASFSAGFWVMAGAMGLLGAVAWLVWRAL